jgi:hypothetical protein
MTTRKDHSMRFGSCRDKISQKSSYRQLFSWVSFTLGGALLVNLSHRHTSDREQRDQYDFTSR